MRNNFVFQNVPESFILTDEIDNEGYDMIYIDYHDGGANIQHNARAVMEAIQWINNEKNANNSFEPNVLIGSSMGGLVGKYALRTMELQGISHDTELFVAMDSPMLGANVPLGVQYAARDIPNINVALFWELQDFMPDMGLGIELLNRPATRQMLIYQCEQDEVEGAVVSYYQNFMSEFHGLGDLENVREIAVTNGSQIQIGQPYPAHTKYLNAGGVTWSTNILLGLGTYFDINIWALANNPPDPNRIYKGSLFQLIWGIPVAIHSKKVKFGNNLPLDTRAGGHYSFSEVSDAYNGFANGVPWILEFALGLDLDEIDEETFCFIPAVSAIDKNGAFDLDFNISNNLQRVTDGTTHFKNYIGETVADVDGFNNHDHEIITNRNSELLRFEMIGDAVNFPTPLTQDYNYGASERDGVDFLTADFFRTRSRITEDVDVQNAELSINKFGRIGFTNVPANPQNLSSQNFDFNILTNCNNPLNPVEVTAITGGIIRIGDNSFGNTSTTYVHDNCRLQAINGSEIRVEAGSNLQILTGAELNINTNAQLILEPNATVEIHPDAEFNVDDAYIEIGVGSTLKIHASALYTMNGGELEIRNNGKLIIETDGEMQYSGGDIFLNGPDAVFDLGGVVEVSGGNKFLLRNEDSNLLSGCLHIRNSGFPEWHFEAVGPNNELQLEGKDESNLILKIDENAEFRPDNSPGADIFRTKRIRRGKVEMANDARIELFADNNVMHDLHVDSEPGSRGVYVYNNNFFNECKFDGGEVNALMFYYNENLRVQNCEFNYCEVIVRGGSFDIVKSEFDDAFMFTKGIINPSVLKKCTFIDGAQFMSILNASTIRFEENSFIGGTNITDHNEIYNQGGKFDLRCNTFIDYEIDLDETYLDMAVKSLNGYNYFSNDEGNYISLDASTSYLNISYGYNTFESSVPNAQFIYKVPNNFFGTVIVKGHNNYWKKFNAPFNDYFDEGIVQERFDFVVDPPVIGGGNENGVFSLTDPYANVESICGEHDPDDKQFISGGVIGKKDIAFMDDFNPFDGGPDKNEFTDPIVNTNLIDSLLLSEAIFLGINNMEFNDDSLGNDLIALDIFYDILMYDYDSISVEVDEMLDLAFQNMKTTIEHTFVTDTIGLEDNESSFHPEVQDYVDVLMHRSDDVVTAENYVEQFYLEIDKAQMFNLIGKKGMAWQLFNNLDNCPVDSTEQDYLNQWLVGVGQEILYLEAGFENYGNDSVVGQIDTTLFNTPSPLEADEFYFGSQILAVDQVTYANCGLITFKRFDETSNRNFMVYPNPTSGILTIAFEQDKAQKLLFKIHDVNGRRIIVRNMSGKEGLMQIDINYLPQATYLYTIEDSKGIIESGQIVKE